jgi:formamidopyrimidine-DNA glycosylase
VHPEKLGSKLNSNQIRDIVKYGKIIIDQAIENKGTTIRSFTSNHESGSNQLTLNVYGMTDKPCNKCKATIKKIKVAGRGTHFCPNCQK